MQDVLYRGLKASTCSLDVFLGGLGLSKFLVIKNPGSLYGFNESGTTTLKKGLKFLHFEKEDLICKCNMYPKILIQKHIVKFISIKMASTGTVLQSSDPIHPNQLDLES